MLGGALVEHNVLVPKIARPSLPALVEEAVEVLGARVRVAVLHALNEHGPSTKADLLRLLGGSEGNLHRHLTALETAGVVVASPSRDDEVGPVMRRYRVDQERVRLLLDALSSAVTA